MRDLRYLTDSYDEKIAKINSYNAPLNFVFITDMHNGLCEPNPGLIDPSKARRAVNAIDSIQYILDRCPGISFVVSGGDTGNDYAWTQEEMDETHKEVSDALYRLSVPAHCVIGNHDDGLGNAYDMKLDTNKHVMTPEKLHELFMKNNPTDKNYYYWDKKYGDKEYRFVFIDTADKPYLKNDIGQYAFGWRNEVSNEQAEWFERVLDTDKKTIVFGHQPLHNYGIMGTEDRERVFIKPYDDLLNGPRMYYAAQSHSNVIMLVAGHVHYDNLLYDGRIISTTTLCSFVQEWSPVNPKRVVGTPTETAFDVFSIDDNKLYITRFGAGEDRTAALMNA